MPSAADQRGVGGAPVAGDVMAAEIDAVLPELRRLRAALDRARN